jgi:hypothetical protein
VAVVSISRIQLRRGRELAGTGIPQLASGELGWAIDTQKLYIGSGAVSEGAPAVENIELLTERSNILDLADQYVYGTDDNIQTGSSPSTPVARSIRQKLDDTVSIRDFAENNEDPSATIQRAIDELFLTSQYSNVTLRIPAGEYVITDAIFVPPFANIVGDGPEKTLLINNGTAPQIFYTKGTDNNAFIDDSAIVNSDQQPRSILIQGMTLEQPSFYEILRLQNCKDSVFRDINFRGNWSTGNGETDQGAILMDAGGNSAAACDNNVFVNCNFSNLSYVCRSESHSDRNHFANARVDTVRKGFVLGTEGSSTGPSYNTVKNYRFTNVYQSAIMFESGSYNTSSCNSFVDVGTSGSSDSAINYTDPVIVFGNNSNVSSDDYFGRTQPAIVTDSPNLIYRAEIEGPKSYTNSFTVSRGLGGILDFQRVLNVPTDQNRGTVEIDYTYKIDGSNIYRNGTMTIVFNKTDSTASLTDNYSHSGAGDPENLVFELDTSEFGTSSTYLPVRAQNTLVDGLEDTDDELKFTIKHVA